MAAFKIGPRQHQAAQLLAECSLNHMKVAAKVGISRRSLQKWRQREEFQACVEEYRRRFNEEVMRCGVANRMVRVHRLNGIWNRMFRIMAERAKHADYADVPGGKTGLLVKTVKRIGSGETSERILIFELDTGLIREMREHAKHVAQELGQWVEKRQVNPTEEGDVRTALLDEAERQLGDLPPCDP